MRPCITCGTPTNGARCPAHTRAKPGRTWAERKRRRDAVQAHIATIGNLCPGYNRPPHPSDDLTADHLYPRAIHGDDGPLAVLCRACNARRGQGGPSEPKKTNTGAPPCARSTPESLASPFF